MNRVLAAALGERAGQILLAGGSAQVIGSTSRGIFLVNTSGEVVFLSYETWRGPLTINLAEAEAGLPFSKTSYPFSRVQQGDAVQLQADLLRFSNAGIKIQAGPLEGWLAPLPAHVEAAGLAERLASIADRLMLSQGITGWIALLPGGADPAATRKLPEFLIEIQIILSEIGAALRAGDEASTFAGIARLFGKGDGLTPSGDDVVVGLLLASQRYPAVCHPLLRQESLVASLTRTARKKTTWLGACLIESAANGQADERLVRALDGWVSAELSAAECARLLQAYGSSSGGDAFVGMGMAIQT